MKIKNNVYMYTVVIALILLCCLYVSLSVKSGQAVSEYVHASELAIETSEEDEETQRVEHQEPAIQTISLGEFKLTAYCSCQKCCGYYATIRKTDEYGNKIVNTASGSIARQGRTIAVDTSVIPFGTKVLIDGQEYIAEDRGGAIKGNRIDVYFSNHQDAINFGVQYKNVSILV